MSTEVVLLGTGTPNAHPNQAGTSIAIISNGTPYLVDFGPGVVRRAVEAHESGIEALKIQNIKHVFLTHMHSDHTAGYADLILTPWVLGREEPLEVYGPQGIKEMTALLLLAYSSDIHERQHGLELANQTGWKANGHEIQPGVVYEDSNIKVEAFPVLHGSWQPFGFKFTTPDRVIVFSGDTAPNEEIVKQAIGCDLLIHEVYSAVGFMNRPEKWQKYHASVHTSTTELADLANRARPGLLVLTHQLRWGVSDEDLVKEIKTRYDGEVVSGKDLDVY
jgi:ribonuclease BN (tRNA processing enzyme)